MSRCQATRTIPIVMSTLADPLREGVVTSLARPGGNTTGLTLDAEELAGKQLELLKEAVPTLSRVAVLLSLSEPYDAARRQIEAAARTLKLEVKEFLARDAKDLAPTFAAMSQARVGAILVRRDTLVVERNRAEVVALAAQRRLPALYSFREFPDSGGLMYDGRSAGVKQSGASYRLDGRLPSRGPIWVTVVITRSRWPAAFPATP